MNEQVSFQLANESHEDLNGEWTDANVLSVNRFCAFVDPSANVLEIGTGTGVALAALHARGFGRLTGFDASAEKLARARSKVPSATLLCGDAHVLPFLSNDFDAVHTRHTLEHMYDPLRALHEMFRVLKPQGKVYLTVPLPDDPENAKVHVGSAALKTAYENTPGPLLDVVTGCGFVVIFYEVTGGAHGQEIRLWLEKPQV